MSFNYPFNTVVNYKNDKEYRHLIREIFDLKEQTHIINDDNLDVISKDEQNYDQKTISRCLNVISNLTKDSYELNELYKLASATMMSLDREIGLAVLFSFDYFKDFHLVLSVYFQDSNTDLDLIPSYERLWNHLSHNYEKTSIPTDKTK